MTGDTNNESLLEARLSGNSSALVSTLLFSVAAKIKTATSNIALPCLPHYVLIMADVTNELILEHLKAIQAKLADMSADIADIKADGRAHRSLTTGLVQSEDLHGGQIASMQARLERIERRLDLSEQ